MIFISDFIFFFLVPYPPANAGFARLAESSARIYLPKFRGGQEFFSALFTDNRRLLCLADFSVDLFCSRIPIFLAISLKSAIPSSVKILGIQRQELALVDRARAGPFYLPIADFRELLWAPSALFL